MRSIAGLSISVLKLNTIQIVLYLFPSFLYAKEKEHIIYRNMDETHNHTVEWKNTDTVAYILMISFM